MPDSNSVFFPFDVDAVQAADRDTIQAHGAYLGKNSGARVRVEGNADERGSSEYNLGLGQRRANNVRKALILAGAKDSQIETVSFGEEKPRASGHDEESWAQNRRADIVYK
jgi:peptidoglycan-associated lipoprotein